MDNQQWVLLLGLCCVLPVIGIVILSVWVMRRGQRIITPEIEDLQRDFDKLKAKNPNLTTDQLVNKIIQQQAFRAGLIGAITSVGGILALPLGLVIDLYTTSRIQNATLFFIAQAFASSAGERLPLLNLNEALALRFEDRMRNFLIERGSVAAQRVYRRLMLILVEKTFAKLIPGIGLIIGFIVNYSIARGISQLAAAYYSGQVQEQIGRLGKGRHAAQLPGDTA